MPGLSDIPTVPVKRFVGVSDYLMFRMCQSGEVYDIKANAKDIGRRVAHLRTKAGLTQEQLAAEVERTRSFVAGIESGGDTGGLAGLILIADYFKVPLDWLLGRRVAPGGPLVGHFVDEPEQLAWLDFWLKLDNAERAAALRLLKINAPGRDAA